MSTDNYSIVDKVAELFNAFIIPESISLSEFEEFYKEIIQGRTNLWYSEERRQRFIGLSTPTLLEGVKGSASGRFKAALLGNKFLSIKTEIMSDWV